MARFYEPDLGADPNSPFARYASGSDGVDAPATASMCQGGAAVTVMIYSRPQLQQCKNTPSRDFPAPARFVERINVSVTRLLSRLTP